MYGVGVTSPTLTMTSHPGEEPDGDPIKLDQIGISHLSFSVPDVKALAEELVSKGVQLAGPLESRMDAQGNLGNFYVYDPDGILIQFDSGDGGCYILRPSLIVPGGVWTTSGNRPPLMCIVCIISANRYPKISEENYGD